MEWNEYVYNDYVTAKTTKGTLNVGANLLSTGTLNLGSSSSTNNVGDLKIVGSSKDSKISSFITLEKQTPQLLI